MSRRIPFSCGDLAGEIAAGHVHRELEVTVRALVDPSGASRTLHWGRNYLYVTSLPARDRAGEGLPVVVKQFRNDHRGGELVRKLRGSKAERSWVTAWTLLERRIGTPEPIAWIEDRRQGAPSYYVCRHLADRLEARHYVRALNVGDHAECYPRLPPERFLAAIAGFARRLHDAGVWHRDLSAGNLLLDVDESGSVRSVDVVDLNRARHGSSRGLSLVRRMRDLCRLPLERRDHQELLLGLYFGGSVPSAGRLLYRISHRLFHGRHRLKNRLRVPRQRLKRLLGARSTYPHIPPPPDSAPLRERAVWDPLSDQPHMHAGPWRKLTVRLGDAPIHATALLAATAAAPRIVRRFRQLQRQNGAARFTVDGVGVGVHPRQPRLEAELLAELGVRHVLLRLHPWEEDQAAAETLAAALVGSGVDVAFALPQRRELVRDTRRWREAMERVAPFTAYGRHFIVGQAINRSKWGVWNLAEYQELASIAAEVLRARDGVEILGPGVIDFEPHVVAAALNWPRGVDLDGLATLLYVDRRGAPEETQLGLDTAGKSILFRAIADSARHCASRLWISEVNWPLWEGPHAPAGRDVAVDEETAADYLVRYYLLALGTGLVERVYWWQLLARGYGLATCAADGVRRRPAFHALATLQRLLTGSSFLGALSAPPGGHLYHFASADGAEIVAGWSEEEPVGAALPGPARALFDRDGQELPCPSGTALELTPSVRYAVLRDRTS